MRKKVLFVSLLTFYTCAICQLIKSERAKTKSACISKRFRWSWWHSKPRSVRALPKLDPCQPQSYCIKNHKSLVYNPVCLSCLSRFFILDIPTAPLVMHVHRLPDFAQGGRLAVRANGDRVVGEVLEELEALAASGALVNVERHQAFL